MSNLNDPLTTSTVPKFQYLCRNPKSVIICAHLVLSVILRPPFSIDTFLPDMLAHICGVQTLTTNVSILCALGPSHGTTMCGEFHLTKFLLSITLKSFLPMCTLSSSSTALP